MHFHACFTQNAHLEDVVLCEMKKFHFFKHMVESGYGNGLNEYV